MYSPKIDPLLIPIIYRKAKESQKHMTEYVNDLIREKLNSDIKEPTEKTIPETKPDAA
jgi:ribosomal protein S3AE